MLYEVITNRADPGGNNRCPSSCRGSSRYRGGVECGADHPEAIVRIGRMTVAPQRIMQLVDEQHEPFRVVELLRDAQDGVTALLEVVNDTHGFEQSYNFV